MNTNIITIITAVTLVLSGAIAGYITTKYAVRWLFKPVTLFGRKIFDVSILSTDAKQQAFIASLSACVEEKILTSEVLKKEIINETLKKHIDKIIEHFVTKSVSDSFKSIKLSEIKGFTASNASLREFISEVLSKNIDPLLTEVLDEIKISDYLTDKQINTASDSIYQCIRDAITDNHEIKEQLTSLLTELFFMSMFNPEGRSAIGKLTAILFKGKMSADISSMSMPEKISASIKNMIVSAVSGMAKNKSVKEYTNTETRQSIEDKLSRMILKKYTEASEEFSQSEISELSSLILGQEKLKTAVSDMIFDHLDKNINRILRGKVGETVSSALGRLDPDQLCGVAERLMKGELKYLSYLGGFVGFVVSIPALLVTLGGFAPSGFPQTPGAFIFLVLLMAFIGVITNVIAITMFFHPYKQNRALAKFRHTRCLSQGLILQNQKVFAHTLGEYIGAELLTTENIKNMLDTHKETFISQLSSNIIPYIVSYLESEASKRAVSAKISALILNKLYENREKLAELLTDNLKEKRFIDIININNPEVEQKAMELYGAILKKVCVRPEEDASDSYDFKFILYAVSSMMQSKPSLNAKVWNLLKTFYISALGNKTIGEFFSLPELSVSAKKTIVNVCRNDGAFEGFRNAVDMCIYTITSEREKVVSDDFVEDISVKCSEAAYNSMIDCLPSLISDLKIANITEEKVAQLKPDEIQSLVMSFAAPAFKKLYALGCIGAVFGINSYLGFILFIIDKIVDNSKEN